MAHVYSFFLNRLPMVLLSINGEKAIMLYGPGKYINITYILEWKSPMAVGAYMIGLDMVLYRYAI